MADCTAEARSPLSAARVSTAINAVVAHHAQRDPRCERAGGEQRVERAGVDRGREPARDDRDRLDRPPRSASRRVPVDRPRGSPRSVRYQWPSSSPSVIGAQERRAREQLEQRRARMPAGRYPPSRRARRSTERHAEQPHDPGHRLLLGQHQQERHAHRDRGREREPHRPRARPRRPAPARRFVDHHAASASTSRIEDVRVKNPRLTSFHNGAHHRNASEPATASASTSAMYPAAPVTCSPSRIRLDSLPGTAGAASLRGDAR